MSPRWRTPCTLRPSWTDDDAATTLQQQDSENQASEAAKRRKTDSQPASPVSTASSGPPSPVSTASSDDTAADYDLFLEKCNETIATGLEAIKWLKEELEIANSEYDGDGDVEAKRVAIRNELVKDPPFRRRLQEASQGLRVATDIGCDLSDGKPGYEPLRNDWGHTTFDEGDFRVEFADDGGCIWHLRQTNKRGTRNYTQDIGKSGPGLTEMLAAYKPIAFALRPAGQVEAPVLCVAADQKQNEIGRMLSHTGGVRAGRAGYNDNPVTQKREDWFNGLKRRGIHLARKCKPRHVVRFFRDGTPAERAATNAARDSSNPNYGTGSTAQGQQAAAAVTQ